MAKEMLWKADLENGMYRNPILHTDYSDPDVIRVGDTFYMTASSFNYIPGLPILISKDLVNWNLVNYAVKNIPYKDYDLPAHGRGIWAPSIRYHDNKFWIFVGMPDEGIFMTNTEDPLGEWSPLTCVWEGKGFIDPCPLWDDDGRSYVVHAYAKSRIGFKSKLGIFEISPDGKKAISEDRFIFDGTETQPTIEGPKIYKRDGMYYILAPAGGVSVGWQTALRSKNIYGPYEEKIVMHQGNTDINGPHQGGLVDTLSGEEWFIHFQDKGVYGRICHLQPVNWENGWSIIGIDNDGDGIGEPVLSFKKPDGCKAVESYEPDTSDDFTNKSIQLQWQWLANSKDNFYSLSDNPGKLRLYNLNTTGENKAVIWNSANILTQKVVCPTFVAEIKIDFTSLSVGSKAGMLIIGGEYASMCIERTQEEINIVYLESEGEDKKQFENIIERIPFEDSYEIYFKMEFNGDVTCTFYYSIDGLQWSKAVKDFFPKKGTWVGARIGIFAITDGEVKKRGYADFSYFKVTKPH
ncbi:glycoside hydrolase 43 family protein [Clostridium sp.]|uniref:glycoside hydrolase family 43 protein n=1 Tax=Clostridium sp. TaxID=1506 RepID=UPI0028409F91|nr:glycoside hydrolase 43 family protein [Clostridium sp.]MDR3594524.1 glycoside hydrolase 43 family protein [Clostridium sp.]